MSFNAAPGGVLAASRALRNPPETFTRAQVAYLIKLAYVTGQLHGLHETLADNTGAWTPSETPRQIRARRVAARLAEYGPSTYRGGPVDWETGA